MSRFIKLVLSSAAIALGTQTVASAQVIEQSRNVYHVAVCDRQVAPGMARCNAHVVTDFRGNHIMKNAAVNVAPSGYNATQLRSAYNITAIGSSNTVIAIVDAYGYTNAQTDLTVYRSTFGLPACGTGCFTKYNESGVQGNYPKQNTGWAEETALDLDMVSAMCPNCKIILVEANSSSYADLAATVNTAARLGARVITNSYGGGESGTTSYETAYNHTGVAITAAAGDSGYGVSFPASSPHVIAVGGTTLQTARTTRGWTETVWSESGSGCSAVYAKPTWQKDPLCTKRMVADVSAVADPSTGVAVYAPINGNTSAWQVYGGTSVSTQIIGGIYGANGGAATYGSNPYAVANTQYLEGVAGGTAPYLNDVTSGSDGRCGGTYFCTAGPGYDGPTGLGTPNGAQAF